MSSARVRASPWASRPPQWRLTRSSILATEHIRTGNFTSLAAVTRSLPGDFVHVPPCTGPRANTRSLNRLLMTSQRRTLHVKTDNTMKSCPSIFLGRFVNKFGHTERNCCCCCGHVFSFRCRRRSSTHVLHLWAPQNELMAESRFP